MESLATGHWLATDDGDVVHARLLPDVKLTVTGDFGTLGEKLAAARFIAHWLNQAIEATPQDDNAAADRVYLGAAGVSLTPVRDGVGYVRADIAAALSKATGQLAEVITALVAARQAERERILAALDTPAHIAVMPDECLGVSDDRCYELGAKNGGQAVRLAIKAEVAQAMKSEE
ncbi:hypothetical protein CNECB9_2370150 [Cupriavidus necator]|uniref:Uncharacterized protein n=1 Tax=Cupriavidus necator TaxID=106590 RepID=A0A1K0JK39_CUPNE|nr:hypothetical protein CNECB9_2370150 [Cupriavidus necator]